MPVGLTRDDHLSNLLGERCDIDTTRQTSNLLFYEAGAQPAIGLLHLGQRCSQHMYSFTLLPTWPASMQYIYSAFACAAMADSLASPRFFTSPCLPFCSAVSHIVRSHARAFLVPATLRTGGPFLLCARLVILGLPSAIGVRRGQPRPSSGCSCLVVSFHSDGQVVREDVPRT